VTYAVSRAGTLVLILTMSWSYAFGLELFVAPNGADTNPGTLDKPLATLVAARNAVRKHIAAGLAADVTVNLRAGTYRLEETLTFDTRDSGTAANAIVYQGYKNERVVISGGRKLDGQWVKHDGDIWKLELPDVKAGKVWFRQLFMERDGRITRATRARWPNKGSYARTVKANNKTLQYTIDKALPVKALSAGEHAELEIFTSWVSSRARITTASGKNLKTETMPGHLHNATLPKKDQSIFLEHAYGFIDQPGEWFLDKKAGLIYLMMAPGKEPNNQTFATGRLSKLLQVTGRVDQPVVNLQFRNLRFHYSQWKLPDIGFGDMWTGNFGGPKGLNWVKHIPVALELEYVKGCRVEMCEIAHMGGSGIGFGRGAAENRVVGCHVHDISAIGINFGWRTNASPSKDGWVHYDRVLMTDVVKAWGGKEHVPHDNAITDNHVHHCGQVYSGCAGIFLAFNRNFDISHNYIHSLPYGCIIHQHYVGEREKCVSSYNQIFNSMLLLGDGGGIYNSVTDVGAHVHHNYVYDIVKRPGAIAWGNVGLYFDDFGNNCLCEENALADIASSEIKVRSKGHVIRRNRGVKEVYMDPKKGFHGTVVDPKKQAVELTDAERKKLAAKTGPREPYRSWLLRGAEDDR